MSTIASKSNLKPARIPSSKGLIKSFIQYLKADKELSEDACQKHSGPIEFFYFDYLKEYTDLELTQVKASDIYEFLGKWYIQKVMGIKKSDFREILNGILKFYRYLFKIKAISKSNFEEIKKECQSPLKYYERFESFHNINTIKDEEEWQNQRESWEEEDKDSLIKRATPKNAFLTQLDIKITDLKEILEGITRNCNIEMSLLDANPLKFEQDFFKFLRYCFENKLKVTKTHLTFHRNDIHAINQKMSFPENLKPNVFQWESHRIQLFSEIAQFLKLIGYNNKFSLVLSVPIDQIPKYPPLHWFTILFDIFWNGIPWGRLQRPYKGGRPEWAQDSRFVLMMAFADSTPNHEYNYHEFIVSYYQEFWKKQMRNNAKDFNSFLRITESQLFGFEMDCGMNLEMGVVADHILPVLQLMGLIHFKFESIGNDDYPIRKITKISITQIGKVFFAEYWKFIVKHSGI